jgi:hypothetical protein
LDLQPWPGASLSYEKLLVGLSRVSTKNDVKILPMHQSQSLNHLFKLKPNVSMLNWLAGYNADGRWCPELARDAVQRNPCKKQRQAKSSCPLRQQGSQTKQKTSQPSNSKVSKPNVQLQSKLQMRNQTRKATDDSQLSTFRVVSRFPLNLAHAPHNDADKLYNAFHVPKDGHCLFNAFKFSLQIQESVAVAELRRQVVSFIENDTDPMRRLAALNAHIGREQDHNRWIDVDLFDPGTGELDVRFSETWVRYSDHMLGCAWAGKLILKFLVISDYYF